MITAKDNVLIVGLGLIGGSYAKGLRKTGCHISAITRSQATIDYALEHNIIDEGTIEEDPALIGKADFVIFGLYPHTMIDWIRRNQQHFKPGALLTDVAGVKCGVVDVIQSFLRKDVEFLGTHPMAGREVYGVQNSDAAIFHGANFIITPTAQNSDAAIAFARELAEQLGFNHITEPVSYTHLCPTTTMWILSSTQPLAECIPTAMIRCWTCGTSPLVRRFST